MKRALVWAAGLGIPAAAAVIALWPGLQAWLVADDFWHLGYIRFVSSPWRSFLIPQFADFAFRPLNYILTFYLSRGFGSSPLALHAAGIALHALNVILVFIFLHRFLAGPKDEANSTAINQASPDSSPPAAEPEAEKTI